MKEDKISVIIPVYNAEKNIEKCLKSVIEQTYNNLEIIIINDGSTDRTISVIKELKKKDSRIVLIDKKNEGVSVARNIGIKNSTGKYVNFVDSDDWLEPDALEILYNEMQKKNVDVVRASYYRNYANQEEIEPKNNIYKYENIKLELNDIKKNEFIEELYFEKIPCYVWLLLIKRDVINEKISFRKDIAMMEDTIFYLELMFSCKSLYISDKKIYHYFCNPDSACKSVLYLKRNIYDAIKVNIIIKDILAKNNVKNVNEKLNALCLRRILINLYRLAINNKKDAIKIYQELKCITDLNEILEDLDVSILENIEKIQIFIFKYTNRFCLMIFFEIRKKLADIKTKLLNRLE